MSIRWFGSVGGFQLLFELIEDLLQCVAGEIVVALFGRYVRRLGVVCVRLLVLLVFGNVQQFLVLGVDFGDELFAVDFEVVQETNGTGAGLGTAENCAIREFLV